MSNTILPEFKACKTCGASKLLSEYHKNETYADGHVSNCKECRKISSAIYSDANKEKIRLKARVWRENNREVSDKRTREWAIRNPSKVKANRDKHRHSTHGIASAKDQVAKRDPAKRRAIAKKYYLENRDQYRSYVRNRRARVRGAEGTHTKYDIAAIAALQEMKCIYCGCDLGDDSHGDHIMPLALGGGNGKDNMQVLCPLCNRRKSAKHPLLFLVEAARRLASPSHLKPIDTKRE